MPSFLHCADLHLDSPLRGLSAYPGAPVEMIRGATRRALESLVELALAERVGAVVIAGDVYDGDWKDFSTGLFFRAQMARLHDAGIEVVLIHGNHDADSVISRRLTLPHVHVLSHERPETVILAEAGLAVHGQSFATRAVMENLAVAYPRPEAGMTNIGVLHTSLGGAPGHDHYAPAELSQLVAHGYDYWALGHIHERAVLHADPYVVYPGNLQGRHMRETGPRGATLVRVDDDGRLGQEHRSLDHVRWERVGVDAGGVGSETELLERAELALRAAQDAAQGRLLATRLQLAGMTGAFAQLVRARDRLDAELRALATDVGFEQIWLERIDWEITPLRSAPSGDEALSGVVAVLRSADADAATITRLADRFHPLALKLPAGLRHDPEGIDPSDEATIRRALTEAREMLPGYLLETVS